MWALQLWQLSIYNFHYTVFQRFLFLIESPQENLFLISPFAWTSKPLCLLPWPGTHSPFPPWHSSAWLRCQEQVKVPVSRLVGLGETCQEEQIPMEDTQQQFLIQQFTYHQSTSTTQIFCPLKYCPSVNWAGISHNISLYSNILFGRNRAKEVEQLYP